MGQFQRAARRALLLQLLSVQHRLRRRRTGSTNPAGLAGQEALRRTRVEQLAARARISALAANVPDPVRATPRCKR